MPEPAHSHSPIQVHGEPAAAASPALVQQSTSGKAIASLVLGVLGVSLFGLIFGILALRDIGRSAGALGGRGLAIAGIIISSIGLLIVPMILLSVAIPTFMAQKDAATGTMARANVKQVITAVEVCATRNLDGSYTGCTGAAELGKVEPAIGQLLGRCGQPGGACVEPIGTRGYQVTAMTPDAPSTTFIERHGEDGSIQKTCSGPTCQGGTW